MLSKAESKTSRLQFTDIVIGGSRMADTVSSRKLCKAHMLQADLGEGSQVRIVSKEICENCLDLTRFPGPFNTVLARLAKVEFNSLVGVNAIWFPFTNPKIGVCSKHYSKNHAGEISF